ncbi:MAG: PH domain-containing protein, partial [Planctomycetota bacterium JB042]
VVPRRRIQTVSLVQSPFQRRLGLATVIVRTAGTAAWSRARIVDLGEEDAQEVFDVLAASAATLGAEAV